MSYISDWKDAEDQEAYAISCNPLCDMTETCPAPDDGHLIGCKYNRKRLGLVKVIKGTENAVSLPHKSKVYLDEVEHLK